MPLSELYRSAKGKKESPHQKTTDISYIPNDEFIELVWEKGQVMMQGQCSKGKKTPVSSSFQFHSSKFDEKEGLLGEPIAGSNVEMRLNQDDDLVPWLNYPIDDYCPDLLPEVSGVSLDQSNGLKAASCSRTSHLNPWSLDQAQILNQTVRSRVSDSKDRSKPHSVVHNLEQMVQKQESLPLYSTSSVMNFSHFSRAVAMARANLQNSGSLPAPGSCASGAPNGLNVGPQMETGLAGQAGLGSTQNAKSSNVVLAANGVKEGPLAEKSMEPIGASSSVCSGNSVDRASNDLAKDLKRKSRDMEDFESQSEDIEEESLRSKTASTSRGGTGTKRSRAAEVHNLSERRRRDRINEKMRALQELIPNCNKVDKASMLDEAIEYLKTLQLQVQIMSMGTGLCMPSMMFPSGMQHMYRPHVPHFSGMGMGYGMGIGMGMGMAEINGGSQGHPHMFGSRHPVPSPSISYGQGMPMVFPQPPMPGFPTNPNVRHMGTQAEATSSKDAMQNNISNVMTQASGESQFANGKDQVSKVGCDTPGVD